MFLGVLESGPEDETEISPAGRRRPVVVDRFAQTHGLAQHRAREIGLAQAQGPRPDFMKDPGLGYSIAGSFGRGEAAFEHDRPGAPSRAEHEGRFEQPAYSQD